MSVIYRIPHKSRYIQTSNIFSTTFGAITPGVYDFSNDSTCQNVQSLRLATGSIFLIDRISAGGNIGEELFLEAIDSFPLLTVRRSLANLAEYQLPIPIVQYFDNTDASAWIRTDKKNDWMTLTLSGVFRQLPAMVGLSELKIQISFSIYEITDAAFVQQFRGKQAGAADMLRG